MTRPTFIIGDIHGRADLLRSLIQKVRDRFGPEVAFFHVGDLVDRGPEAKDVIQVCIDEGIEGILGNHETWLHKLFATGEFDTFALHPMVKGDLTLASYGIQADTLAPEAIAERMLVAVPREHQDYILKLPLTRKLEVGDRTYRLIHAGLKTSTAVQYGPEAQRLAAKTGLAPEDALMEVIAELSPASILWTSNSWKEPDLWKFTDGSVQVFGHSPTPQGEPVVTKHWIGIDCGCRTRRAVLGGIVLDTFEGLNTLDTVTTNALELKGMGVGGFTDFTL